MEQPWHDKTCDVNDRYGKFGQIMPQEEFLLLMQACDVFDLVKLDKDFVAANKPPWLPTPSSTRASWPASPRASTAPR